VVVTTPSGPLTSDVSFRISHQIATAGGFTSPYSFDYNNRGKRT
jgi:hypothetical protein